MLQFRHVPHSGDQPEKTREIVPPGVIDDDIVALLRSGSFEEATEGLVAAWQSYLPSEPALLAERIRSLPESHWERDPTLLIALAAAHRTPGSSNPFAALEYLDAAAALIHSRPHLSVQVAIERARALRGLGRFRDARGQALLARQLLEAAPIGMTVRLDLSARALFEEGACLALMGELGTAARQLRHGMGLVADRVCIGSTEARGWLAVIDYFLGGADDPQRHLAALSGLSDAAGALDHAPALFGETLVALDDDDDVRARIALDRLEAVAAGTEFEVLALQLRASSSAHEPLDRLDRLHAVALATQDWQSAALVRSLHDAERAATLIRLGSFGAARDAVTGLPKKNPLHAQHASCPAVLPARLALHSADYDRVLALTAPCRTMGDHHAPRTLATVEVLRAAAHDALGDAVIAGEAFDHALLQAARTGWRRHFQVLPPARLATMLEHAAARSQPTGSLVVLRDLGVVAEHAPPDAIAPLSSRERIVLARIAAGQTRRQISSQLRVSPNTVKAQLRSIYRKLGATNRHEALDRAARFGLAD